MSTEVEHLARDIQNLSPPDRLRLAASLMDARRGDVAYDIARRVVEELGAAIALAKMNGRKP